MAAVKIALERDPRVNHSSPRTQDKTYFYPGCQTWHGHQRLSTIAGNVGSVVFFFTLTISAEPVIKSQSPVEVNAFADNDVASVGPCQIREFHGYSTDTCCCDIPKCARSLYGTRIHLITEITRNINESFNRRDLCRSELMFYRFRCNRPTIGNRGRATFDKKALDRLDRAWKLVTKWSVRQHGSGCAH
jgi:hypothetical protein